MIDFVLIEEVRQDKEIPVTYICTQLDINKSTYSRWVNNKIDPAATKLKKLCDLLEISIEKVFK